MVFISLGTNTQCHRINYQLPVAKKTYPFRSMKRICGCVEMYSTVGVRVPIWRLTMLLNKCTTSFFPYKDKRTMNGWLMSVMKLFWLWDTNAQPFCVCTTKKYFYILSVQKKACFNYLKVNLLQVCNESNEEVRVVQLLCKLSHCFSLGLLVTCSTKNLLQWGQIFGHLLCDLNRRKSW